MLVLLKVFLKDFPVFTAQHEGVRRRDRDGHCNRKAVIEVSGKRDKKVSRVKGRDRVCLYAKHCNEFNRKAKQAKASIGQESYQKLVTFIKDAANKMSHVDLEVWKNKYSIGIEKKRKSLQEIDN